MDADEYRMHLQPVSQGEGVVDGSSIGIPMDGDAVADTSSPGGPPAPPPLPVEAPEAAPLAGSSPPAGGAAKAPKATAGSFKPGNRFGKGAGPGNVNASTHGITRFVKTGVMPKGTSYLAKQSRKLGVAIENVLIDRDGTISLTQAAAIQSVCRSETCALLAARWLAKEKDLSLADRLACLDRIAKFSKDRDAALKSLGLDARAVPKDLWKELDV